MPKLASGRYSARARIGRTRARTTPRPTPSCAPARFWPRRPRWSRRWPPPPAAPAAPVAPLLPPRRQDGRRRCPGRDRAQGRRSGPRQFLAPSASRPLPNAEAQARCCPGSRPHADRCEPHRPPRAPPFPPRATPAAARPTTRPPGPPPPVSGGVLAIPRACRASRMSTAAPPRPASTAPVSRCASSPGRHQPALHRRRPAGCDHPGPARRSPVTWSSSATRPTTWASTRATA